MKPFELPPSCFPKHFRPPDQKAVHERRHRSIRSGLARRPPCVAERGLRRPDDRLKELTEISADTGDPGEAHNRAALVTATRHNLEQITGALRRIAEDSYGRCEKCGGLIPAERLEVLPHTRFCVPFQQKHKG
nr:TraR/DksA C4-type zinc finger protein [Micromonospora provocatoris]